MSKLFRKNKKSLTPQILKMFFEDKMTQYAIAKKLGCTEPNVWAAIRREKNRRQALSSWNGSIERISDEQVMWLEAEAARTGTTAAIIARSLLVDAINDEMDKNKKPM